MKEKDIVRGPKQMPRFRSVEEESDFWDEHDPLDYGTWRRVSLSEVLRDFREKSGERFPVTLRLDKTLIRHLKKAARQAGTKYQTLAREILWQSLRRG
ncbi:MAG: hypothetical protein HYT87_08710 [Nitrospirae bacterium]|nr:hypothetical protein [Nitrospirota bacterium]